VISQAAILRGNGYQLWVMNVTNGVGNEEIIELV
jgi:hypothetical protein